jgi:hypothetical protein
MEPFKQKRGVVTRGLGVIPPWRGPRDAREPEDESIARIFGKHEIPAPVSSFKRTKEGSK